MALKITGGSDATNHVLYQAVAELLKSKQVGQWGSDHQQEAKSYSGWNYLAIATLGRIAARAHGYVYLNATARSIATRKSHRARYGSMWKSIVQDGSQDLVPDDHWLSALVDQPNMSQSGAEFRWEYIQQMHLHGCCLIFNRPSLDGGTAGRYIVPMALTEPVYAGQNKNAPNGGVKILPYQAGLGFVSHPFVSALAGNVIPIEHLSIVRFPHPMLRGDGQSPTDAAGWWTDSASMIDRSRWKQLKRGPRPHGVVSVEGDNIGEKELSAIEKRLNQKLGDDQYDQRVIAVNGNVDMSGDHSPREMDYSGGFDQYRDAILAIHGVGKASAGLTESMTYGSVGAALLWTNANVQSDLDLLAGDYTLLAKHHGANVSVEFEVAPIDDPTLVEQQLATDIASGIRLGREVRALRGLPPFGDWRDNARVTAAGFVVDGQEPPKPGAELSLGSLGFSRSLAKSMVNPIVSGVGPQQHVPVVAVDLDGTLAEYDGTFDPAVIGAALPGKVEQVRRLKQAGCKIVIFTCRENDELTANWLDSHGVPYDSINCNPDGTVGSGKVFADIYWDDRALSADCGIDAIAQMLPNGIVRDRLLAGADKCWIALPMPPTVVERVREMQATIDASWLSASGLENDPHVTVLWGVVGSSVDEVVQAVRRIDSLTLSFGAASTFDHPEGFVLKVDVECPSLLNANAKLRQALPVSAESHPDYKPHLTICYMSGNEVQKFVGANPLQGLTTTITQAVVHCGNESVVVPLRTPMELMADDRVVGQSMAKSQPVVIYQDEPQEPQESTSLVLAAMVKSMIEDSEKRALVFADRMLSPRTVKKKSITANRLAKSLVARMAFPKTDADYRQQVRLVAERVSTRFQKSPVSCLKEDIDCSMFLGWRRHVEDVGRKRQERADALQKSLTASSQSSQQMLEVVSSVASAVGRFAETADKVLATISAAKEQPVEIVNNVHVSPTPVDVHVAAPNVQVDAPVVEVEVRSPDIVVPARRTVTQIERDAEDRIARIEQLEVNADEASK